MSTEEQLTAVKKMQKFIKDNFHEELSLKRISEAADYSPWYCAKIFKQFTGKTLFEYIRSLRLSEAALKLRDSDIKIIDVAFDFHFSSHEGFTRAFSKQFGITPKTYSKKTPPIQLFIPYLVENSHTNCEKGENIMKENTNGKIKTVFVQVVDRDERKFILKRGIKAKGYFEYCEEVSCEIWGILTSIKEAINEPMGVWLPEKMIKEGTSEYAQGVEVSKDFSGVIPEGFEIIELPKCKMMIFQGEPFDDALFREAIQEVWDSIDKYNPGFYGFEWAPEDAPRFQLAPQGYRGYIEGKPVRLKKE